MVIGMVFTLRGLRNLFDRFGRRQTHKMAVVEL